MKKVRILIIEDDNDRLSRLKAMLPEWAKPVSAVSAGRSIGLLERDSFRKNAGRDTYAGILLQRPLYRAWQQDPKLVDEWRMQEYPKIVARAKREKALIFFADESGIRSDYHAGTTWCYFSN